MLLLSRVEGARHLGVARATALTTRHPTRHSPAGEAEVEVEPGAAADEQPEHPQEPVAPRQAPGVVKQPAVVDHERKSRPTRARARSAGRPRRSGYRAARGALAPPRSGARCQAGAAVAPGT